ncbi:MAG: serine/threonine protein kinase [Kiritimatiellae bacterium]|nr:serine/threonine protein kinase [Kiritimatiellia bacterium]
MTSDKQNNPVSTIVSQKSLPTAAPLAMSLQELRGNYNTILKANAIHYPVAYQFVRELGRGRQGRVFLSHRQGARGCITKPAIKVFDPGIYRSVEEYWTDMGRIASQISQLHEVHGPHLVSRHSYEEAYGIGYVEMDAIDGMDIRKLLDREHTEVARKNCTDEEWHRFTKTLFYLNGDNLSFHPGAVVHVMRRVLRGLERLHNANFLHCDIKPANIMIDRLGSVKIVDFGRAVIQEEKLSFMLGAPMYLAPETHRREPIGVRSDLYSVGLIGLEMLIGHLPIRVEEMDEDKLLESKIDLAENLSSLLPIRIKKYRNLVRTIRRLISPDPDARYSSARDAEDGSDSLKVVDRRFVQARSAIEYEREFADYLSKLVDERTERIEISESPEG